MGGAVTDGGARAGPLQGELAAAAGELTAITTAVAALHERGPLFRLFHPLPGTHRAPGQHQGNAVLAAGFMAVYVQPGMVASLPEEGRVEGLRDMSKSSPVN